MWVSLSFVHVATIISCIEYSCVYEGRDWYEDEAVCDIRLYYFPVGMTILILPQQMCVSTLDPPERHSESGRQHGRAMYNGMHC